jgi:hypothetical protein
MKHPRPAIVRYPVALFLFILVPLSGYWAASQWLNSAYWLPQNHLSNQTVSALNSGSTPASLTQARVNLNNSNDLFMLIYDKQGHAVAGTGYYNNQLPNIPSRIMTAQKYPYSFVLQLSPSLKFGSVAQTTNNNYVVVGRSTHSLVRNQEIAAIVIVFLWIGAIIIAISERRKTR